MIQIRRGVFETNSSSTHSICISRGGYKIPEMTYFRIDEWGWEIGIEYDTASYLYTAIITCFEEKETDMLLASLKDTLDGLGIRYEMEDPEWKMYSWGRDTEKGGIDHGSELLEFVEAVLNDSDLLLRYLYGDSFIATGNDNNDRHDMSDAAFSTIYDFETREYVGNPHHDEGLYEYFYKGN